MSDPKYRVEPAKTGRSTCKASKQKIEEGELRFGTFADMMGHPTYQWRKLSCITARIARNVEAKMGSIENVGGYEDLSAKQKNEFKAAMETARGGTGCGLPKGRSVGKTSIKSKVCSPLPRLPKVSEGPAEVLPLLVWLGIPNQAATSYVKLLDDQGFDSKAAFLTLTKDDLDKLGVLLGHSRLIMRYISSFKEETSRDDGRSGSVTMASSSAGEDGARRNIPSFAQRSAAARRWKRRQEAHPESISVASKFHRSRSKCLAEETGLGLNEVRQLLRENDEALAVTGAGSAS